MTNKQAQNADQIQIGDTVRPCCDGEIGGHTVRWTALRGIVTEIFDSGSSPRHLAVEWSVDSYLAAFDWPLPHRAEERGLLYPREVPYFWVTRA